VETDVCVVIKRLIHGDWFTAKISGILLIPVAFAFVGSGMQGELMNYYKKCIHDEVPQVRRTVGSTLKDMIALIPKVPESEVINIFNQISKDDQDSVRLMSVENAIALTKVIPYAVKIELYYKIL
jgi:serine/threonine-protein phosphatase 2A regulatory subunit A